MRIGDLGQHCGECGIVEYCGNPFGYCVCTQMRFADVDDDKYRQIAENAKTKPYGECAGCTHIDDCDDCDIGDDAKDWYCEQIADYTYKKLFGEV